jgi:predicted metal-dependent phosphoesterase TrpH
VTPLNDRQQPLEGGADLHLHSLHSDGSLAPAEILAMAGARGLAALSLTDHDTIAGLEEAAEESRKAGITFIPGIELGVTYGHSEIHLLGYGIDPRSRRLRETLDQLAAERFDRMEKMVQRLRRHGVPADFEEVRSMAGGTILSRLHLATYLYEKKFVGSRDEAFQRYIGNGGPAYVRRRHLNLKAALDLIIGSGGFPVLAHPALTRRDDLIEYLVRLGVRGIEVYYPRHSFSDISHYRKICRKYGLVATGGSDFHGGAKPDIELGASLTPPDELSRLLRYLGIEFS